MAWKVSADPVDFDEAITWFRKRVPMTREAREALAGEARLRAFWISQVAQADIVAQTLKAIDDAVAKGTTFADFKKAVGDELRAAWGGTVDDPAWRLETIYRTNVQGAYSAGRYRQATDPAVLEDRPVWMFDAILDGRETPICRACDGTKQPADNPWWRAHSPPLHFNCRSSLITMTAEEAGKLTTAPAVDAPEGFGKPLDPTEPWTPEPDRYPVELEPEVTKKLTHEPEYWLKEYSEKYGEAAPAVAWGRAALERGLDMPKDELVARLKEIRHPLEKEAEAWLDGTVRERLDALTDEQAKAKLNHAAALAGHMQRITPPTKIDATPKFPSKKPERALAKALFENTEVFMGKMLAGSLEHNVRVSWSVKRAFCRGSTIQSSYQGAVLAHEWGHALEHLNPKLLTRAKVFLAARTKGERATALRKLFPGVGYRATEMVKPDKFFHAYVGKLYDHATEITSMGLESLFDDRRAVASLNDFEHLLFTLGQLADA